MFNKNKVIKALHKKGFVQRNNKDIYFEYVFRGKVVLSTKVSHGPDKTLSKSLIGQMYRQCHLTRGEFEDLVNCPLGQHQYENLLKQRGILD